jgi:thymidylate synthase (FAD)
MSGSDYFEDNDLQFKVFVDIDGTSPQIQSAIWKGQHTCVCDKPDSYFSDEFDPNTAGLSNESCGDAIVKHQLNVEHFSVLNAAFISFKCYGFPHSVMQQATRHRDSAFLVTSMRYTGKKFVDVANGDLEVAKAFYVRPEGIYSDRAGKKCNWTQAMQRRRYAQCRDACLQYKHDIEILNMPFEMAREFLPFCYRQPFDIFTTVEGLWHLLDQRTKTDSEREIQILASLLFSEFEKVAPELAAWYKAKRYGKARLAP